MKPEVYVPPAVCCRSQIAFDSSKLFPLTLDFYRLAATVALQSVLHAVGLNVCYTAMRGVSV